MKWLRNWWIKRRKILILIVDKEAMNSFPKINISDELIEKNTIPDCIKKLNFKILK